MVDQRVFRALAHGAERLRHHARPARGGAGAADGEAEGTESEARAKLRCRRAAQWRVLRRAGGLGRFGNTFRYAPSDTAIDRDWDCLWPLGWRRHYRQLTDLAARLIGGEVDEPGGVLSAIEPGLFIDDEDLGRFLQRRSQPGSWAQLAAGQQEVLTRLGIKSAPTPPPTVTHARRDPCQTQQAFLRAGGQALTQYAARAGEPRLCLCARRAMSHPGASALRA
ncbi:hypothetical protein ACGFSD_05100 [Streptomyces caniferus]|uniref:hypothetical protein n=1 Tax=Streptomyces caniferus TaxID=285557 RepID=UPI003722CE1A